MIPYITEPNWSIGPVSIHSFGIMVALAIIVGQWLALRRSQKLGLDADVTDSLFWWAIVVGFIAAHLYSVLLYFPDRVQNDPLLIFKLWDGISSVGGILGGLLGIWLYFRIKQPKLSTHTRLRYLDVIAYIFPFGWVLGRMGCSLAHDHPGLVTHFPLSISLHSDAAQQFIKAVYARAPFVVHLPAGIDLSRMGFFDLGLIEMLFSLLFLVPVFLFLDRKPRPPLFYLSTFVVLYTPVRFGLDFLRLADAHYAGLTPAQWGCLVLFTAGIALLIRSIRYGKIDPETTVV